MAETITEVILPGTYIEVRAEGLLSGGLISTGNVGVIGTAEMGEAKLATLSSFEDARKKYGTVGDWDPTAGLDGNVHLVRALRYLFANGARTVFAQRIVDEASAKTATIDLTAEDGPELALRAKTPGTWANRLQVRVESVNDPQLVPDEIVPLSNNARKLSAAAVVTPDANGDTSNIGTLRVNDAGISRRYVLQASGASTQVVTVGSDRALTFETTPGATADVRASYWVPAANLRRVTLRFDNVQEVYVVPSFAYLAQRLEDENWRSQLVEVVGTPSSSLPKVTNTFASFAGGENGGAPLNLFEDALDRIVEQDIQIVVVAGKPFSSIKSALLGHLETTENLGRERIAVIGADSNDVAKIVENSGDVADKRLVLVGPGLAETDRTTNRRELLPPFYAASAVAGKLSSLSPHISLTNKTVAVDALATEYNYGELKTLVQNRVLTLQTKRGTRIVRGITTDDGAFQQISVRRIVDYVKEGTRQRCNQFIGLLNNRRVRASLQTTLDAFLADLLVREFLVDYKLTVTATRPMEIRGEVLVTMDIQPTFSIDYVRVIMNLS